MGGNLPQVIRGEHKKIFELPRLNKGLFWETNIAMEYPQNFNTQYIFIPGPFSSQLYY